MGEEAPPLERRTWVYVQDPVVYEMSPHSCGTDGQWSEFKKHLWCPKCEVDFIPEHAGVFDGPVCAQVCKMIGISFDQINLETQELEKFEDYINTPNP